MSIEAISPTLVVNDEIELVQTGPDDGPMYVAMLKEESPLLEDDGYLRRAAHDDCLEMYEQVSNGMMLSYWISHRNKKVGHVGVTHVQDEAFNDDFWTMDYWLLPSARGQRIMPWAARKVLEDGFDAGVFSEVQLNIVPANTSSKSVARAIGAVLIPSESTSYFERWKVVNHG